MVDIDLVDQRHDELLDALDEALALIRRVPRRPRYRQRFLGDIDMPGGPTTVRALRAVELAPSGTLSVGDLAAALALDVSTVSRAVEDCVRSGLFTRTPGAVDRRRSELRLTEEGRAMLARATENRRRLLAEATEDWSDHDLEALLALLRDLGSGFDRLEVEP